MISSEWVPLRRAQPQSVVDLHAMAKVDPQHFVALLLSCAHPVGLAFKEAAQL